MRKNDKKIKNAKIELFSILVNTSTNELQGSEMQIMFLLSGDKHVQEYMEKIKLDKYDK